MSQSTRYHKRHIKRNKVCRDTVCYLQINHTRPPFDEKLFPDDRLSGFKRADWNFFSILLEKSFFFPKKFVHSSQ